MIYVSTADDKVSLAAGLERHDKGMLEDLKKFAVVFGPLTAVGYEPDNPATEAKVGLAVDEARLQRSMESEDAAARNIEEMKRLIR